MASPLGFGSARGGVTGPVGFGWRHWVVTGPLGFSWPPLRLGRLPEGVARPLGFHWPRGRSQSPRLRVADLTVRIRACDPKYPKSLDFPNPRC